MKTFADDLAKSLSYIDGFFTSYLLFHLLDTGIYDDFSKSMSINDIVLNRKIDSNILIALIRFLAIQGIMVFNDNSYELTEYGKKIPFHIGWFLELVGGYGPTLIDLRNILRFGKEQGSRNGKYVALGSGEIDYFDIIPLVKKMITRCSITPQIVLDIGCGSGSTLISLCEEYPLLEGNGIEPNQEICNIAKEKAKTLKLDNRVTFLCHDAWDYIGEIKPDLILSTFVLHEIAYQRGIDGLISYLKHLASKFPTTLLLIVEVDGDKDNYELLRSPMGSYYKCYFLLHELTKQELLPAEKWENIFKKAGYKVIQKDTVDSSVDTTGLEIGYILSVH